ncbi:MAG: hypothetical protein AAB486_02565 [Patescibacteria group bacterium]
MELIFADKNKRTIKGNEKITFSSSSSLYLLKLTARAKGEKQLGPNATDDEDLTIQIDAKIYPKLGNPSRFVDSPAAISGGKSYNLSQTTYFLTFLKDGDHQVTLSAENPPGTATFESLEVYTLEPGPAASIGVKSSAEDGDRRPWLAFILDNIPLAALTVNAIVKKRYRDSDDLKIVVDGEVKTNFRELKEKPKESLPREWFYRFWYFAGSLLLNKQTTASFRTNLPQGLHYVEIYADRMPYVDYVELDLSETAGKIREYKDNRYNKYDTAIEQATRFWNNFFLTQNFPPPDPLNPDLVKAMIYIESRMGYGKSSTGYPSFPDVMQVWDERNKTPQHMKPEEKFKNAANEFINEAVYKHLSYSYPPERLPIKVTTPQESIFWGVRWLYHKAQQFSGPETESLNPPYRRWWLSWREAVYYYNASAQAENYTLDTWKVHLEGTDSQGETVWAEGK